MAHPSSRYGFRLDYYGAGFHGIPYFKDDLEFPERPPHDPWLFCAYALARAKRGDFAHIPTLLDLYGKTGDLDIDSLCMGFLAAAGPASSFSRLVKIVRQESNLSKTLPMCGAMSVRGELSYVPIFLDKFLADEISEDAQLLAVYIRDILGYVPYSPEADVFEDVIMERYERTVEQFGSDSVLLFRGDMYSVTGLARFILEALREPVTFRLDWRINFEAATGIDCTSWYQNGRLRPLAAAATVEEFLESPQTAGYEVGTRYFFGHRIPE